MPNAPRSTTALANQPTHAIEWDFAIRMSIGKSLNTGDSEMKHVAEAEIDDSLDSAACNPVRSGWCTRRSKNRPHDAAKAA